MRYLTVEQVIALQERVIAQTGGASGIRDRGSLEAAAARPAMTFAGEDLYPTLVQKAAALGHSLIQNHPFVDGNKRIGHAAMEVFLVLNGYEIDASIDEQEQVILTAASGQMTAEELGEWLEPHIVRSEFGRQ